MNILCAHAKFHGQLTFFYVLYKKDKKNIHKESFLTLNCLFYVWHKEYLFFVTTLRTHRTSRCPCYISCRFFWYLEITLNCISKIRSICTCVQTALCLSDWLYYSQTFVIAILQRMNWMASKAMRNNCTKPFYALWSVYGGEVFRKEVVRCWPLLNLSMVLGILRPSKPLKVCTMFCPKKQLTRQFYS
jgi:hypothetical protein